MAEEKLEQIKQENKARRQKQDIDIKNKAIEAKNEYMTSPEYEAKQQKIALLNVETRKAIKQKEQEELIAKTLDHAPKSAVAAQVARSNFLEPYDASIVNQLIFDEQVMKKAEEDIQKIVDKKNEDRSAKYDLFREINIIANQKEDSNYEDFLQDYPEFKSVFQHNEYIQHPTQELNSIVQASSVWHSNNNNHNNSTDNGSFVGDGWSIEEEDESK